MQRSLFEQPAACAATREVVLQLEQTGALCPLCGGAAEGHEPEDADVERDDRGDFGAWMMSLPRSPA